MKKFIIIFLFVFGALIYGIILMTANSSQVNATRKAGWHTTVDGYAIYLVTIDKHDYIVAGNGNHYGGGVSITHNENCKFCK